MIHTISRVSSAAARLGSYDPQRCQRIAFSSAIADFTSARDTPRAFLERCLAIYDEREPDIHAFAFIDVDGARRAADAATRRYRDSQPLSAVDGCPVAFKDTLETADMPTQQNSAIFEGWIGNRDAACVWALRKQGAVVLGKTQVPELALGQPPATRNPFDLRRTPGGSSSGSGAAVGAGMVPVAIGNQTMGSLIRPASYNGNYGYKPTWGALNVGGMHPLAPSLDHIGPMAATLADMWRVAYCISAFAGGHNGHPGLQGGPQLPAAQKPQRLLHLKTLGWSQLDDDSREAFESFLQLMDAAGIQIVDATRSDTLAQLEERLLESDEVATDICMYELRWPMAAYLDAHGADAIGQTVRTRLERGLEMSRNDYRDALSRRDTIREAVRAAGHDHRADGFISLASSGPAPLLATDEDATPKNLHAPPTSTGSRSFLSPWSLVGGPSLALPWLAVDGMPLGVQLMGFIDSDLQLVSYAHWLDGQIAAANAGIR